MASPLGDAVIGALSFGRPSSEAVFDVPVSIASSTELVAPNPASFIRVTGTTSITSIAAADSLPGRNVVFQFTGVLTFTNGNNLKLESNFTTAADATITLVCDGADWYEVSRVAR